MPPFKLELPERTHLQERKSQLIYTKNVYGEGVKVKNWQNTEEQKPIDVNPFCQGNVNQFLGHYHRFGTDDDNRSTTTTKEMLQQVFTKKELFPAKHMNCYYTYDNAKCLTPYQELACSKVCSHNFITTMQHSYRVPKPYIMQKLAIPKIPVMQNRKFRKEIPDWSSCKFYDDNFEQESRELRKYKFSSNQIIQSNY